MTKNLKSKKFKSTKNKNTKNKNTKNKNTKNKNTKNKKKMRGGNMFKKTEAVEDIRMKSGKIKKKKSKLKQIIEIKELMDSMKEQMLLQMKTFEKINLILGDHFTK
jgi:hypothetical protein